MAIDYAVRAKELVEKCSTANSETAVAARIEEVLRDILRERGIDYEPVREKRVIKRRGRIDSQFGAVVTEYKKHISSHSEWEKATEQLVEYITDVAQDPSLLDEYLGIVTDGRKIRFILFDGGKARPEIPAPIDSHRLRRWVDSLIALHRRGLTSENLLQDFGLLDAPQNSAGRRLAQACYKALQNPTRKTWMLRNEWRRLFAQSVDHRKKPETHIEAYRRAFGFGQNDEIDHTRALFALQTTYAIIVKLVALRVLSELRFNTAAVHFHELATLGFEELRRELERMEDGHLFRELAINNLLEGDFFAWYVDPNQWTPELYEAIQGVITTLSDYEGRGPTLRPGTISDIFRQLYQRVIPPEIRHDLGEYYTPHWLAQAVIQTVPKPQNWRGLDPCCGSGTFLVEMIALVLEESKDKSPAEQLNAIISRIKGIDLNPLAVLTSRVNYLLAIGHLLELVTESIEIPVYLGDAAYLPRLTDLGGVQALSYKLTTDLGPLAFSLPLALARDPRLFGAVMSDVEREITSKNETGAEQILLRAIGTASQNSAVRSAVRSLVRNLVKLEQNEWNRIWARIIKNFLATAAIGQFECVVGNPPWVEWKDLPNGYRETIKDLCRQRGLFSDDRYVGGTDLNISALIAHTVLEQWVAPHGYLCFLMPKGLLQLRSTQGFRRWRLPDGSRLSLVRVEDWSELRPFEYEDVANEPASYLIQRGAEPKHEVPMIRYRSRRRLSLSQRPDAAWADIKPFFKEEKLTALQIGSNGDPYIIDDSSRIHAMKKLLGNSAYRGRRATETSPQSVYWLKYLGEPQPGIVLVENDQNPRARRRVPKSRVLLETSHLYPMIQGRHIRAFRVDVPNYLVLLPHNAKTGMHAIPEEVLRKQSKLTYEYLARYRSLLERRGSRSKYRGDEPFYALWRVGPYTFAPYKVVWPEIGKMRAAVVSRYRTPWGEEKIIVPEGKVNYIACESEDEAHFVCGFLNAPLVRRIYAKMSSAIGRPVRLPFAIPQYDSRKWTHRAIAAVSRSAHNGAVKNADKLLDWLLERLLSEMMNQ